MKDSETNQKNVRAGAAIVVLAVAVFCAYLVTLRGRRIEVEAKDLGHSALAGDGAALLSVAWPQEIAANHLTAETLDRFLRDVVLPHFHGARLVGDDVYDLSGGIEGVAHLKHRLGDRTCSLNINLFKVGNSRRLLVSNLLYNAWSADYLDLAGKRYSEEAWREALRKGREADLEKLKALGIRYVFNVDEEHGTLIPLAIDPRERQGQSR